MDNIKMIFIDLDDTLWNFSLNSKIALRYIYDTYNPSKDSPDYNLFSEIYEKKNTELWNSYHYGEIKKEFLINERFRF